MKRRDFVRKLPILGLTPFMLDGIIFNKLAQAAPLQRLAAHCPNDRVLIILQLHGGNDGLNTVVPFSDYDKYYNNRPNIALPDNGARRIIRLDSTLAENQQAALHPDMSGAKALYDEGKMKIVQGVSYENHNGSHFRSRDIMFMGGGAGDYTASGWVGRYLKSEMAPEIYPDDFPNDKLKDPPALEFGNEVSLVFHQGDNISTSIAIDHPQQFFDLVTTLPGFEDIEGVDPRGVPPEAIRNSPYGKELEWILSLENKADQYDGRLLDVYNEGKKYDRNVTYPTTYPLQAPTGRRNNPLVGPMKVIANLISGGCDTKVYLVRLGGFDTHAQQVSLTDRTTGNHAALLYHISETMKAFQEDLKVRGIEDRVLTVTTSEFGRRVYSNGSLGTDHGTGAPMMIFGKGVNPGVLGVNPDLDKENVEMQFDYRQLYASILKDWMCVDPQLVDDEFGIFWGDYTGRGDTLPIISSDPSSVDKFIKERFYMNSCYPNPTSFSTTISFFINVATNVRIVLKDLSGREIKILINESKNMGEHRIDVDLNDVAAGTYLYEIRAGQLRDTKKLVIIR